MLVGAGGLGQFVIEALMMAAAGGVIGIPRGAGLTALVCRVLRWPVFFDVGAIIVAFSFTLFVGLAFGYFGSRSHSGFTEGLTSVQIANRRILCEAMVAAGFKPLAEEWWHFTLKDEPYPDRYFDFPVR